MFPLSIQVRQALAKLVLPLLFVLACLVMLIGKAQPGLIENIRLKVMDFLVPAYALVEKPFGLFHDFVQDIQDARDVFDKNKVLREENAQLKGWYHVAMGLVEENVELKKQLHWIPDVTLSYVTARIVADGSGVYHKAVLVMLPSGHGVHVGEIALNGYGLVGRVTEVGKRSARILLINDTASRIPVSLVASHAQAIMAGDNTAYPQLIFYPEDKRPVEGEKVITDNHGNAFPEGIPIGYVHYLSENHPVVVPYINLGYLKVVRIFDYDSHVIFPPDAPGRINLLKKKTKSAPVANPELLEHDG